MDGFAVGVSVGVAALVDLGELLLLLDLGVDSCDPFLSPTVK